MKQKITIVVENNEPLKEALLKHKLAKEKFDEITAGAWEYLLKHIISLSNNETGNKIVSVKAETLE